MKLSSGDVPCQVVNAYVCDVSRHASVSFIDSNALGNIWEKKSVLNSLKVN